MSEYVGFGSIEVDDQTESEKVSKVTVIKGKFTSCLCGQNKPRGA